MDWKTLIPKKGIIDVYGTKYKIQLSELGNDTAGLHHSPANIIEINSRIEDREYATETLLHELFHAIFLQSSIDQTEISPEVEQIIVNQIAKFVAKKFDIKLKKAPRS